MLYATYAMMLLHTFVGVILIGIILLQRGRGGGLAGAFGGLGGQSAFGNKAGDVFTRITIVLAVVWMVLGCVCVLMASNAKSERFKEGAGASAVDDEIKKAPANEELPGAGKAAEKDAEGGLGPAPENPPKTDAKPEPQPEGSAAPKDQGDAKKEQDKEAPAAPEKKGDSPAADDAAARKPE